MSIRVAISADLEPLIPRYLENRRTDLIALRTALKVADWETVRAMAHTIKGTGGAYGFETITAIAETLEIAAKANDMDSAAKCVEELTVYVDAVDVVFVED
jgi:HPt (histidine-containing phosphotransfer) domain-containing protein